MCVATDLKIHSKFCKRKKTKHRKVLRQFNEMLIIIHLSNQHFVNGFKTLKVALKQPCSFQHPFGLITKLSMKFIQNDTLHRTICYFYNLCHISENFGNLYKADNFGNKRNIVAGISGFIQASISKIQGLFKDFQKHLKKRFQGLNLNE